MLRLRSPWFVTLLLAGGSAALGLISCGDLTSSNTAVTSITGVLVRAETLTAGRGCGPQASQVFKVAAVVYGRDDATNERTVPVAANTYDCFSDVTFVDLPPSPQGNVDYRIDVFLYNRDAYEAQEGVVDGARAATSAETEAVRTALATTTATWSTSCLATQLPNVQSLAVCDPVAAGSPGEGDGDGGSTGPATIELATGEFTTAAGEVLRCRAGDAGANDAGATDAGNDDAGEEDDAGDDDAGNEPEPPDAAAPDAAASGEFDAVRVRWRTGEAVGPIVDVACPTPFVLPNAPPGSVVLDVGLSSNGQPLGQTSCTATATAGQTSSAVCAPLP